MTPFARHPPARPSSQTKRASPLWPISLIGLALTLLWDASGLDLWVMAQLGSSQGFAMQHNWWLEAVLHDGARQLAWGVLALLALMVWRPIGLFRHLPRRQRTEMLLGTLLALLLISTLKHHSLSSCPWDLQQFGGVAEYRSHWAWGLPDGGPGKCFPGGHASAAFAFLALPLSLLASELTTHRHTGWWCLTGVLLAGIVLGATQTLRGAHYPSHNLWTALICWTVALLNYLICRAFPQKTILRQH